MKSLSSNFYVLSSRRGQSLVEILVALVVGSIFIIGAVSIIVPSLRSNTQVNRIQIGAALGKELLENVRVSSEGDWHIIYNLNKGSSNHYYLTTSTSPFAAVAGNETIRVSTTTYSRYFYVDNVGRDAGGNILSSGGTDDPSTQKVTVVYNWANSSSYTFITYLTRFMNKAFDQTDWFGGPGQDGPATTTNNKFSSSFQINYTIIPGSITTSSSSPGSYYLDSTTYDTGVANGAQLNSVLWHGSRPAGTIVHFVFATSNSSSGPWTFVGPDGTGNTYYSASPDASLQLDYSLHNNQRYFRYRVTLVPNQTSQSPQVDEIIVNWSP